MDPRIHFALNCASQSCPPIGFYHPDHVLSQLDIASNNFVDGNIDIDPEEGILSLSAIFRWYKSDFGTVNGVVGFILDYLPDDDRKEWILANRNSIRLIFQPYDWTLNDLG